MPGRSIGSAPYRPYYYWPYYYGPRFDFDFPEHHHDNGGGGGGGGQTFGEHIGGK